MSSFWERIIGYHPRKLGREASRIPNEADESEEAEQSEGPYRHVLPLRYLEDLRFLVFTQLHRLALQRRRKKHPRPFGFDNAWKTIQLGALQVLTPAKDPQAGTRDVFARAHLERAELTESYTYEQEISRNPSRAMTKAPEGTISLAIPYDGHKYFTRQARRDVEHATGGMLSEGGTEAIIGHLLLTNYENTNLGTTLNLSDKNGAVPVRVPVATDADLSSFDCLTSDRKTCVIDYDYAPSSEQLKLHPIDVQMELLDPDSLGTLPLSLPREAESTKIDGIVTRMTQQVNFRPYLWLRTVVSLHLPTDLSDTKLTPKIVKMTLHWPTITSLDALRLTVGERNIPLRYNPATGSVEWSDIPMALADETEDDSGIRLYQSPRIILEIKQPGELYREQSLNGLVEVEVPGYLMSGLDARLFSATGSLSRNARPKLVCNISAQIRLILDDAFAKREFSPWQQLYFDEMMLEEARITDIVTALQDRGFEVDYQTLPDGREDRLLLARRREGPDYMFLWLLIERQRYQTERANKVPGGHTYKSMFESGELRIFIRGTLPRDSRELTHEMNMLQLALRERFDRVRARR